MSRLRRSLVGLVTLAVLTSAGVTVVPPEVCTTDLHCAQMFGVDLYGNPYLP